MKYKMQFTPRFLIQRVFLVKVSHQVLTARKRAFCLFALSYCWELFDEWVEILSDSQYWTES